MGHPVTLIRGDGIGPEVAEATRFVIDATGVAIDWHVVDAGVDQIEKHGTPLPKQVIDSIRDTKIAIKGPIATSVGGGFPSVTVELCKTFNLFANLRPAKLIAGIKSHFHDIDLIIVRENTEDLYAGIEFERTTHEAAEAREFLSRLSGKAIREDAAIGVKPISVLCSRQIVELAFKHAIAVGRKKVTAVHKANIMKFTDGLFLDIAREVAKEYPQIEFEDRTVDEVCLQLVQRPERYDVLVMPNLYGDILSNLCAGMIGGLGVAPSVNMGLEHMVFESMHGSDPDIAGQNKANPTALILSGVMMLQHMGEIGAANKIQAAVKQVIAEKKSVTEDLDPLGEPVGTSAMAEAIASAIHSQNSP
jgi:isocitrate dehydrogenase (NAD+)